MPPTDHLTTRNKQILVGGLVLALGMVVGVSIGGDDTPTREAKLSDLGSAVTAGSALTESDVVDVPAYHASIVAVRVLRPDITDLLTPPVEPGAEVSTEVNLPLDSRIVGAVEYVGPAAGKFVTVTADYTDAPATTDAGVGSTRLKLTARNTSTIRLRMTALIQFAAGG